MTQPRTRNQVHKELSMRRRSQRRQLGEEQGDVHDLVLSKSIVLIDKIDLYIVKICVERWVIGPGRA